MKVLTLSDVREQKIRKAYLPTPEGLIFYQQIGTEEGPVHFEVQKKVYAPFSIDEEEGVDEGFEILNIQSLGKDILSEIVALFRRVYADYKSEMIVCLGWDKKEKRYTLERPKCATIGPGYLAYRQEKANIGTVHSHGGFGASFSTIDDKHEMDQPGIYMVLGNFDKKVPSMVASITALGKRQLLKIPDLEKVPDLELDIKISDEHYGWWMERTMLLSDIKKKNHGWFVLDWKSEIVWWADREDELTEFQEPGLTIVPFARLIEAQTIVRQTWYNFQSPATTAVKVWTPSQLEATKQFYTVTNKKAIQIILKFLDENALWQMLFGEALDCGNEADLRQFLDVLTDAYDGCEIALEDYPKSTDPHFDAPEDDEPTAADPAADDPAADDPVTIRNEIEEFYNLPKDK